MVFRPSFFHTLPMRRWILAGLCALVACSESDKKDTAVDAGADASLGPPPTPDRLSADGQFLRDSMGRAVTLRGVNARVEGVFDVTFDDGRTPLEEVPALDESDCKRMSELGFTILRLPINWSGIEPERDKISETYLKRVDDVIACMREQGIYVLVDLHQDAYSKEIGEDGAPLWAIVPKPDKLLEGPLTPEGLTARRFSQAVSAAQMSFFAAGDPNGLQAEFIEVLELVAKRYKAEPAVLGIDLFNEPFTSPELLRDFQGRAGEAVHSAAPDLIVTFEPSALWATVGGEDVVDGPYPVKGAMYAPHLYALAIGGSDEQLMNVARADLLPSFQTAAKEAKAWGAAWMIGELGGGPTTTNFQTYLRLHYDLQDEFLVSSALWLWKESSQDSWGLYDYVGGKWQERPAMVELASRPHVLRTAGTPTKLRFTNEGLSFSYNRPVDAPNLVFIPERFKVASITCDGTKVNPQIRDTRVQFRCGKGTEHSVEIKLAASR